MSAHSNSRAEAPGANGMIVRKPWNSPGKSRCTTGTLAARNRCAYANALAVQQVEPGGHDDRRRQALVRVGPRRRDEPRRARQVSTAEVLLPVPLHRGAGVDVPGGVRLVAERVERRIDHRIDQHLSDGHGRAVLAAHERGDGGEVSARAVTGDQNSRRIDAEFPAVDITQQNASCTSSTAVGARCSGASR